MYIVLFECTGTGRNEIFYLRLYGVRHMVKDHSDSKFFLYASSHRQDNTTFVKLVVEHWLER